MLTKPKESCPLLHWRIADCNLITTDQLEQIHAQMMAKQVEEAADGESHFQGNDGSMLLGQGTGGVRTGGTTKSKLYLDTCTTNDLITQPQYLSNVRKAKKPLYLHSNCGSKILDSTGNLGEIEMYADNTGIASVISLRTLEKKFPNVEYSSDKNGGAFVVTTHDERKINFKRCANTGFPYIDLDEEGSELAVTLFQSSKSDEKKLDRPDKVKTIRKNYEGWTLKEVENAIRARKAQARAGHPSEAIFKNEVNHKSESSLYRTCPITAKDITNAKKIFGPSEPCIKGKQVRTKPERVEADYVSIPANIVSMNRDVLLVGDVMFVSGIPCFVTLSRRIRFVTVQHVPLIPDRRATTRLLM